MIKYINDNGDDDRVHAGEQRVQNTQKRNARECTCTPQLLHLRPEISQEYALAVHAHVTGQFHYNNDNK